MSIRMVVTDLDGTLLRNDKSISELSLAVFRQCRKRGVKVVYATGRGNSAIALAPSEHFDGAVRMNGAMAFVINDETLPKTNGVKSLDGETLIHSRLIPRKYVIDLLTAADKEGISIAAENSGVHYANFNAAEQWSWIRKDDVVDFRELNSDAEKMYAIVNSPRITELINKHLPDNLHLFVSRDNLAMIMHKEAAKSLAIAALAKHWHIEPDGIVAFGDDVNDIDMLKYCGIGVAMGNALDEVKAAADQICDTNENDGIAKWLESREEIWM